MTRYRYAGAALAGTLLATTGAGATTDGTVYDRFQQWIDANPPPPDTFAYDSVEPLGDDGLLFTGLTVAQPGEAPVTIERVALSSLDFDAVEAGTPPNYVTMDVTGMALPAADLDDAFGGQDVFGQDPVMVDLAVDYRLDEAARTLSLSPLTVTLRDLGTIEVAVDMSGIDPASNAPPELAMLAAMLDNASVRYVDDSLLSRVVTASAEEQGQAPDAYVEEIIAELTAMTQVGEPSAAGEDFLATFSQFLRDYDQPAPLTVTAAPPAPVSVAQAAGTASFDQVAEWLGLSVTSGN